MARYVGTLRHAVIYDIQWREKEMTTWTVVGSGKSTKVGASRLNFVATLARSGNKKWQLGGFCCQKMATKPPVLIGVKRVFSKCIVVIYRYMYRKIYDDIHVSRCC